ncbi:MAG: transpeptidase family protein [Desulfobacterales bacterium]|nr:transpeptidase family protein [Desulfobacterales bacterium]
MRTKYKKWIKMRIYVTGTCFLLVFGVVFLRAYQLQILEGDRLSSLAREGYTGKRTLTTQRGAIFDRNGNVLALSIEVGSIYGYPKRIKDTPRAATLLASALDMDRMDVLKKLRSPRSFAWIKRKATPEEIKRVRELDLTGIGFTKENRRYYPCIETGAHVIGFASQDNNGLEGIELQYNGYLEAQKIRFKRIHDALGRPLVFDGSGRDRQGPFDLILTLDKEISYRAQKVLRKAVERSGARSGVCIVMRPQTGEILAMVVVPEFNPNIFWQFRPSEWRNRAVTDCFEPGSTFKAFLLAAAMEGDVITPETVLNCEDGRYTIGNRIISDRRRYGMLRVSEIIKFSSNIGAIKIGQRLGARRFHYYMKRFGFGERTGIDFPGETTGILRPIEATSVLGQNTLYFGQGISVSPLQLAVAFGAIANGGHLMRPYLVKSIVDQGNKTIREFYPVVRRQVISHETARRVRGILEDVVGRDGTAPKAAIEGYHVAGKTGTAQKVDPIKKTYSNEKFVSFFAGLAPSDSPAIVILVALDEPKGRPSGGIVAAPVFREIGCWTLNHLNVTPSLQRDPSYPAVKGETVIRNPDVPGSIPDLRGLGVRDVLRRARGLGVEVVVKGSGLAAEQSPAPGTPLENQRLLTVTFRPPC